MTHKGYIKMFIRFLKVNNAYREYIWRLEECYNDLKWLLEMEPEEFLMDAFDWGSEANYRINLHNMNEKFYEDWFWEILNDEWICAIKKTIKNQ